MATAASLVGLIVLFAILMVIARGVAREQKAQRDKPYDRRAVRAQRHERRQEHVTVVRTMLFGRWAGGHGAQPPELEEFEDD